MKILVTGAGGYIGSVLVPMLLEKGHFVRAVDRFFFGDTLKQNKKLTIIKEDCRNLDINFFNGIDAVIDLVAISNDPSGEKFKEETMDINWRSRVATAKFAKEAGVNRYILPSSCSIYGFQDKNFIADENTKTNPLTTYAIANEKCEKEILPLADENFCPVVLRQATVYGLSPRMRFDLAINGMTYGAFQDGKLPLMRDGSQWRPMVHVRDTARAQVFMLDAPKEKVSKQIFNVGSKDNVYQLQPLAEIVADTVPRDVEIIWYGDPDHRSYRVAFDKIEKLGFKSEKSAEDGISEICRAIKENGLKKTTETITLDWYMHLEEIYKKVKELEINNKMLRL